MSSPYRRSSRPRGASSRRRSRRPTALAPTSEELGSQPSSQSRAQDEAAEALARLAETQDALARFQDMVERGEEFEPEASEPTMSASDATRVAGALSLDARRSL